MFDISFIFLMGLISITMCHYCVFTICIFTSLIALTCRKLIFLILISSMMIKLHGIKEINNKLRYLQYGGQWARSLLKPYGFCFW